MGYEEETQNEIDYEEYCRGQIEAQPEPDLCQTCRKAKGQERVDNGLKVGMHCDPCWSEMIPSCRRRSWFVAYWIGYYMGRRK